MYISGHGARGSGGVAFVEVVKVMIGLGNDVLCLVMGG